MKTVTDSLDDRYNTYLNVLLDAITGYVVMKELMRRIRPKLKKIYVRISDPPIPNNAGAREIEYSWIFANMSNERGLALDLGVGNSFTGLVAARKGYEVIGIDLRDLHFNYVHPQFTFRKENIFISK
ncbi:MAG: hypothetical protein ACTSRU_05390 [Candidatus Hodarchaeales archaeon]